MTDVLEARLKLTSPILVYSRKNDPAVKAVKKQVQEEEGKIKRDLRNNYVPRE